MDKIFESDVDEIEEYLKEYEQKLGEGKYPKSYKIYEVDSFKLKEKFLKDIESDRKLFEELLNKIKERHGNIILGDKRVFYDN